jgi:hypothetical protein
MELREFVKETLLSVAQGVKEAQLVNENGAVIAPEQGSAISFPGASTSYTVNWKTGYTCLVDFEIALTEGVEKENKKGIGVLLKAITAGIDNSVSTEKVARTSIRFSVPVNLPVPSKKCH